MQQPFKNILSKQLLRSVHHRLAPPPPPLLSICLTEKHELLANHTHTNKFPAMAQGTQCTVTHIPRKRRYDITLSSPLGPWEDRRGRGDWGRKKERGREEGRGRDNREREREKSEIWRENSRGGQKERRSKIWWMDCLSRTLSRHQSCYCQSHRCTNANMQDLLDGMC